VGPPSGARHAHGAAGRIDPPRDIIHKNYSANGYSAAFWLQVEHPKGLMLTFNEQEHTSIATEGGPMLF
jgi:hypothetical protein